MSVLCSNVQSTTHTAHSPRSSLCVANGARSLMYAFAQPLSQHQTQRVYTESTVRRLERSSFEGIGSLSGHGE